MSLIVAVCVILVGIACLFGLSCSPNAVASDDAKLEVTRQRIRSLSREQIRKQLESLETRKAPEPKMGAMCYDMAAPPERAEYVCPKCGDKTLYTNDHAWFVSWDLEACRREFNSLKGESDLALALDETSYCAHCSPSAKSHQLALIVQYADGSSHTNAPISHGDLLILRGFLKGQLEYKTSNDGTYPLKLVLPRLRELLGIDPEAQTEGEQPNAR